MEGQVRNNGLPVLVFITVSVAGALLWRELDDEQIERVQAANALVVKSVETNVEESRRAYVSALVRMAARLERIGEQVTLEDWAKDARAYLDSFQGLRTLNYIDTDGTIKRSVSHAGIGLEQTPFAVDEVRRELLAEAFRREAFTVSEALELRHGGRGALLVIPFDSPSGSAAVVAAVVYEDLFKDIFGNLAPGYGIQVRVGDEVVFAREPNEPRPGDALVGKGFVDAVGPDWYFEVWPGPRFLADARGVLPRVVLWLSQVVALLLAVAVWFAGQARARAAEAQAANERLEDERAVSDVIWRESRDVICTLDKDARVISASSATQEMWGYRPDELVGRLIFDIIDNADKTRSEEEKSRVLAVGSTSGFVTRIHHRDGSIVFVSWTANWSVDLDCFVAIARDITDRVKRERDLEVSAERLRIAVHQTGRVVYDRDFVRGSWDWVGEPVSLLGCTDEYLSGLTHDEWYAHLHPDEAGRVRAVSDAALRTGGGFSVTYRWRRPDDSWVWIEDAGGVTGNRMIGVLTDVTEQREAEAVLEQRVADRTRDLKVANAELEAFSYSVSHDLRTPLRAIAGFAELLDEEFGENLGEGGRHYLKRITDGAGRMGMLIDDLLTLGWVSRHTVKRVSVDLTAMAGHIIDRLRETGPERTVEVDIEAGLVADADPRLVEIVLDNLLGNAWKFTSNRERSKIEMGLADGAFFIRDNGVGFDMAYADQLFGVFQRLHGAEEFSGTGVGLATVERIIDRHGGSIHAEAEEGKFAVFYFKFS
jgi:PAS domain S-box-containing protein